MYFCPVLNQYIMCSNKDKRKFLDEIVERLLIYCPLMSADVALFVACQFALESNFGKSCISQCCNNYCGMRVLIAHLSNNQSPDGFVSYQSMFDCIFDYVYWFSWNQFDVDTLSSLEKFTRKLIASEYCPDKDYIDRIYSIFNQFKSI